MTKKRIAPILGSGLALILTCGLTWQMLPKTSAAPGEKSNISEFSTQNVAATEEGSTVLLNNAKINVKTAAGQALRQTVGAFSGKRMHLVKFNGPVQPQWYKSLAEDGLEIVDYIPSYAYLVYGDADSLRRMQTRASAANSPIEWDADYLPEYRLQPGIYATGEKGVKLNQLATNSFLVQLHKDDEANAETINLVGNLKKQEIANRWEVLKYVNFVVALDEEGLRQLAERPDVISIAPWIEPTKNDERQDTIMAGNLTGNIPTPGNYLSYLAGKGFTQAQFDASGFVVNVSDDGLDSGASNTAGVPNPLTQFVLAKQGDPSSSSRVAYIRPYGSATLADSAGCDGHGNLNTSIIGGYVPDGAPFNAFPHADSNGFRYGLGVAPFVKVGNSTIFRIGGSYSSPNIPNLEAEAYRDGARISSNSWGSNSAGGYNADSQTYDAVVRDAQGATSSVPTAGNQEYTVVFAAGNAGSGASSVGAPGTAKNVITAGASENVQAFGGADGCGVTDAQADNANDIIGFSGRGPTTDGRKKPEIVAPGTHVSGAVAQNTAATSPITGNGTQRACFNASGVCAGVGNNFYPAGQQWYTASSGTSHSTPAIAGAAALVRQYFINQSLNPPSPAMTKALLMTSAAYMNGVGANDNRWSNSQGMGLLNLNNFFDIFGRSRILKDQGAGELFTATGQSRTYTGTIVSSSKPLNVTLAWTEPPGSTTAASPVNNLDLEVTAGGQTYKGNVFTGAFSSTGGTADNKDNAESVILPAGVTGPVVVKVTATNIAGDGVPGNASALDQDFALVAANLNEVPAAVVSGTVSYVSDNGTPVNNVPDPGETVTVNLTLQNVGTAGTGNVTATLLSTGGITNPSSAQSYGTLAVGGTPVSRNFSFQVPAGAACGSQITLTFAVNDGTTTSNVTKIYTLGTLQQTLSENFDGVTAPALPAGWTQVQTGSNTGWVTTTTAPDTAPNAAFAPDLTTPGGADLTSPVINVNSASATLSFRLNYNTESTWDGGILEIKIGSGAFQEITAAGGTFASGGYNSNVRGTGNPLGVQPGWSGNSSGYIDALVNLPAAANGQAVQFKWRVGNDDSFAPAGGGVKIDTVKVFGSYQCATVGGGTNRTRFDFDGDGKADQSVFRPSNGTWYLNRSGSGFLGVQFGVSGDIPAAADFDGDGKADIAVFRPSNGTWYRLNSGNNTVAITTFGLSGDAPVPGDFDGDGKADIAVFRPSNGTWYRLNSGNNTVANTAFGQSGDIPVVGDFDGDTKTDLVVFRPSTGVWYRLNSNGGGFVATQFGQMNDIPVAADYDGDTKADIAVFRPSNGAWYRLNSNGGAVVITSFGQSGDVPTAADYDGDNKADVAVFRPSTGVWYRLNSNGGGFNAVQFGLSGDIAVPSTY